MALKCGSKLQIFLMLLVALSHGITANSILYAMRKHLGINIVLITVMEVFAFSVFYNPKVPLSLKAFERQATWTKTVLCSKRFLNLR